MPVPFYDLSQEPVVCVHRVSRTSCARASPMPPWNGMLRTATSRGWQLFGRCAHFVSFFTSSLVMEIAARPPLTLSLSTGTMYAVEKKPKKPDE